MTLTVGAAAARKVVRLTATDIGPSGAFSARKAVTVEPMFATLLLQHTLNMVVRLAISTKQSNNTENATPKNALLIAKEVGCRGRHALPVAVYLAPNPAPTVCPFPRSTVEAIVAARTALSRMTQQKPESAKIVPVVLMIVMESGRLGRPALLRVASAVPHERLSSLTVQPMVGRIAMRKMALL